MPVLQITPKEAADLLSDEKAILIDVRESVEFSCVRIEGATLIPLALFTVSAIPETNKIIIIHCKKGIRSQAAADRACRENQNLTVYNMAGGIDAWLAVGLPYDSSALLK